MTVRVTVTGGATVDVAWTAGMNAQRALELTEEILTNEFIYSIEYYGSSLGYFVNMINETYDTFKQTSPYYYWEFLVNGTPSSTGIDQTILADGDEITFTFTTYSEESETIVNSAKRSRRRS